MYVSPNFKTKKALKEAVFAYNAAVMLGKVAKDVTVYQPNGDLYGNSANPPKNGKACVEGPHYPAPHSWYAEVTISNGVVTKVK